MNRQLFPTALASGIAAAMMVFAGCSKDGDPLSSEPEAPTPTVTTLARADRGWSTSSGSNGITSSVHSRSPVASTKMEAIANINVGVFEHPVVTAYLENTVAGTPGSYRVETTYNWKGSIAGNGLAGAGARVELTMQILHPNGTLIASQDIHEKEVRESAFQIGGIIDEGSKRMVMDFTLPNGATSFRIRFVMRCEAWSGLFGGITQCHFGDYAATGHHSGWSTLKVTKL